MAATSWETFKLEGTEILARLKELVRQGNLRRIVVEHNGRTVAEFPLTAGVIGIVAAPILAAVGALVAMLKDCAIKVEMETPAPKPAQDTSEHAPIDTQC